MENNDMFDKKVREIFENSNISEDTFEKAFNRLNEKHTNNIYKYIGCVACFLVALILSIFIITNLNKKQNLITADINNGVKSEENNINAIYKNARILLADSTVSPIVQLPNGLNYTDFSAISESDCIALVKLNKILYGTNYIEKLNKYVYPVTVSDFLIEKTYKGNISGNVKIATDTETLLPIDDYVKGGFVEEAERLGYYEMSDEERKNIYIKMPTLYKYTELKEGNYYIAYIKYNKDAELYGIVSYCLFEYNKDTNKIRIPGTDNLEDFELKDYNYLFIE